MKYLVFSLPLLLACCTPPCCAQDTKPVEKLKYRESSYTLDTEPIPRDYNTNKFTYQAISHVDGASKADIFARAKIWMITNLASHESHMNYFNEDAGTIIGSGHFSATFNYQASLYNSWGSYDVSYSIKISTKESKYRYVITDFKYQMISWSEEDYDNDHGTYFLEIFAPPSHALTYSYKTAKKAKYDFLYDIHSHILGRTASLSQAMKVSVLDDDSW